MNAKNRLVVISAPSGAGKTSLCAKLLANVPNLVLSMSSTTRAPRGAEKNGVEYEFLSRQEFQSKIQAGRFAEWAEVHGNFYGTSKDTIERAFQAGNSVLLDIDVQGAKLIREAYPAESVLIFVQPPSIEELEKRLRGRGTESEENIQKRMKNARAELAEMLSFDHVIMNDEFERAAFELEAIVRQSMGVTYA